MNIYVGNLPYSMDDAALREIFEVFGTVAAARVIFDRDTGRSKGFGFIEMENDEEAKVAMRELDGSTLEGRTLRVNEALPRPSSGSTQSYPR